MNKPFADGVMVVTPQKLPMAAGSELGERGGEIQIDVKKDQTLTYFGLPYQDHNYGAPPPPTPPQSPPPCPIVEPVVVVEPEKPQEEPKQEVETSEEEREEEDEGDDSNKDEGITRCICDFEHDDGYMICCDKCLVWQHVECMGLDRSNIPDNYFCEKCEPRVVDVENAKLLQSKKKKHLEELQKREDDPNKLPKAQDLSNSLKMKKKVKKKKKKKEKIRGKEEENKADRKKEKKRKKKDKERGDAASVENQSDDQPRTDSARSEKDELKGVSQIQCTPEVQKMMDEYRKNPEMFLAGAATYHGSVGDIKRTKVCIGQVSKGDVNGVVTLEQIPANQLIMQLSGTLSLMDNRRNNHSKQLESFMFVYSSFCNTEMILNVGSHENIARFTRKSCSPNAEIRHMIFDGEIYLYLFALKDIPSNSEVTLGLDFDFTAGPYPVKCACGKKSCPVKKFWHKQKTNGVKNSNGNMEAKMGSPTKKGLSPLKLNLSKQVSEESLKEVGELTAPKQTDGRSKSEPVTPRGKGDETDSTAGSKPVHKMTREERKMDAIMKAFERLEKSQQRRQQTLERLAQTKERQLSGDSDKDQTKGKVEETESQKEKIDQSVEVKDDEGKEDEMNEVNVTEQEEIQELVPQVDSKPKPRPQRKKKRGSSRKRNRNSSGASNVSVDLSSADDESNHAATTVSSSSSQSPCPTISVSSTSSLPSLLSVQTNSNEEVGKKDAATSLASPAANSKHFKFPKTKRFFMNEWLNEKAKEASADSPLTVKTENFDPILSNLNSPGAPSVRERTTSADASFGSAKKRWLRQAMQETSQTGSNSGSSSPVCNGGGASPVTPSPAVSPNSNSMDFMTPLKKRMLRHSLAEERPSQYLLPKPDLLSDNAVSFIQNPTATSEQSSFTMKEEEEKGDDSKDESLFKSQSLDPATHLSVPARKEVRKNSSIDSGLSVTTPADFERVPSFPDLSDNSSKESTDVRKVELCNKVNEEEAGEVKMMKSETIVPAEPELPKDTPSPNEIKKEEKPLIIESNSVKPKQEEPIVIVPTTSPPVVNPALKRCLSEEAPFNGDINPAYFSPKKRHLYLRQNTDPGNSERSLGGTWPRQDLSKGNLFGKANEGGSEPMLSQSWSGSPEKVVPHQERTSPQASGSPPSTIRTVIASDHHITSPDPLVTPGNNQTGPDLCLSPSQSHPNATSPVSSTTPSTTPADQRARMIPPGGSLTQIADQRPFFVDHCQLKEGRPSLDDVITPSATYPTQFLPEESGFLPVDDPKHLLPNATGSLSAPTTPSKKKVSLLEYRKRKGSSVTKKPSEKTIVEEEDTDQVTPSNPDSSSSPTSSTESTPAEKSSKPANIITFKDKKVLDNTSSVTTEGLQSLPLFSKAPIAESAEGKKLSLTDEAHKLITSLTQVLMEGKGSKEKQSFKMNEAGLGNEDPLQRMRRELNEKNKEKVLALKRALSPEPPPPPPEKKSRLEAASPPVPPPPPPRNLAPFSPGIHSPKAGGIQRQTNHVVVTPPAAVLGVQQIGAQTNGGHVVFSQVMASNTPVAQYQQPIAKHQAHSPRGQNHYSPIAASTSPRGPLVGPHPTPHPTPHPNNFQYQHKNHVEEPLLLSVPNQMGQFYKGGDQGGFHVNGDRHTNRVPGPAGMVTETTRSSSQFPSKFSPVHDKRSSSYSRSSRALSPRRGYHRH